MLRGPSAAKDGELNTDESNRPDCRRSRTSKTDNSIKGKRSTYRVIRVTAYRRQDFGVEIDANYSSYTSVTCLSGI